VHVLLQELCHCAGLLHVSICGAPGALSPALPCHFAFACLRGVVQGVQLRVHVVCTA
jgi:hypothetical protein